MPSGNEIVVKVDVEGTMHFIWDDKLLPLMEAGAGTIRRASRVDFDCNVGGWMVDILTPLSDKETEIFNNRHEHWFWKRIQPEGDCWLIHNTPSERYPIIRFPVKLGFGRKCELAHRLAFWLYNGYYPENVRHYCDRTRCVRPAHLLAGTPAQNVQDAIDRGRAANGNIKLNPEKWEAIRASNKTVKELAEEFGVDTKHIRRIRKGESGNFYRPAKPLPQQIVAKERFGPFTTRTEAIAFEVNWLKENVICGD